MAINSRVFLFLILLFGVSTKVLGIFVLPIFHDVGWYRASTLFYDGSYMNLIQLEHPYLGYYFFLAGLKLFGIHDYVVRVVPFIFSLVELCLLFFIAKKWYDYKTAIAVVMLWSLTFFSYINALSPEGDGSIMAVFSIFLFYFLYYFLENFDKKNLILSGIFYGLLILIKVRGILFLIPITIYFLYIKKNIKWCFVRISILCAIGLAVFSIFPFLVFLENPEEFTQLMMQIIIHNTGESGLLYKFLHPLMFLQVFVVLSPLYLFLFLKGMQKKWANVDALLIIWFISLFVALLALLPAGGLAAVYPRYISFLLPPLLLLSAKGLVSLKYSSKQWLFILFFTGLLYGISHFINELAQDYWYYSSAAMGVYKIAQPLLLLYLLIPLGLLFFYRVIKNKLFKNLFLSAFFIITLTFNFHFILEPVVDGTHKNILKELQTFHESHVVKKPLFFWAEDLAFYMKSNGLNIATFTNPLRRSYAEKIGYNDQGHFHFDVTDSVAMDRLKSSGGTVYTLYVPYKYALQKDKNRQNEDKYLKDNCTLLKSVVYKIGRGEIWEC